jgi:hypothetical protein
MSHRKKENSRTNQHAETDAYSSEPMITVSKLKLVIPLMLEDTLSDSVAKVTFPTASVCPSLFQLKLMYDEALTGLQFCEVRPNLTARLPSLRT